jgi:hypothetical protein
LTSTCCTLAPLHAPVKAQGGDDVCCHNETIVASREEVVFPVKKLSFRQIDETIFETNIGSPGGGWHTIKFPDCDIFAI